MLKNFLKLKNIIIIIIIIIIFINIIIIIINMFLYDKIVSRP